MADVTLTYKIRDLVKLMAQVTIRYDGGEILNTRLRRQMKVVLWILRVGLSLVTFIAGLVSPIEIVANFNITTEGKTEREKPMEAAS